MTDDAQPLIEVTLPAPIEEVWAHLRDPTLIRRWFGWEYDGLSHEIDVIFLQEPAVDEREHTVEWDHGIQHGDRFELVDLGEQTLLRLVRWVPTGQEGWDGIYDDIGEGWTTFVAQLQFALERHPGEERSTLHLSGAATAPGGAPIDGADGERLEAIAGQALSGEVLHRGAHQIAVSVEELDGLLVMWHKPDDAHGTTSMTLTTYGAAPDEAAWRAWWAEHAG